MNLMLNNNNKLFKTIKYKKFPTLIKYLFCFKHIPNKVKRFYIKNCFDKNVKKN
jgi:hypothetical protein